MKQILYILFLTSYLSNISADDSIAPLSPDKYTYITLGSSIFLQKVGVGKRYRNLETSKGHDIEIDVHFSLPSIALDSGYEPLNGVYPSLKYTYLTYETNSHASPYYGVAFEGLVVPQRYSTFFIPNVGLVWGQERENMRFSQLQLNLLPALGLAIGTGLLLFGGNGGFISERAVGGMLAGSSALVLCSYSVGF